MLTASTMLLELKKQLDIVNPRCACMRVTGANYFVCLIVLVHLSVTMLAATPFIYKSSMQDGGTCSFISRGAHHYSNNNAYYQYFMLTTMAYGIEGLHFSTFSFTL